MAPGYMMHYSQVQLTLFEANLFIRLNGLKDRGCCGVYGQEVLKWNF